MTTEKIIDPDNVYIEINKKDKAELLDIIECIRQPIKSGWMTALTLEDARELHCIIMILLREFYEQKSDNAFENVEASLQSKGFHGQLYDWDEHHEWVAYVERRKASEQG